MNYPWLRLYTEIVDDEKLRLLAFEDRWHFVALLCCKGKGILEDADRTLVRRKIAVKLGLDLKTLDEVARRLAEVGLIDESNLQPLAWEKRQRISDHLDRTNADRQRRHRERKKDEKEGVTESNARYVTKITAVESDTDIDTDKDLKNLSTNVDSVETSVSTPVSSSMSEEECLQKITPSKSKNVKRKADVIKIDQTPYQEIIDLYHTELPELCSIVKITPKRRTLIRNAWRGDLLGPNLENWKGYFNYVATKCPFLMGKKSTNGENSWEATFEWLLRPENTVKVIEGTYERKSRHG